MCIGGVNLLDKCWHKNQRSIRGLKYLYSMWRGSREDVGENEEVIWLDVRPFEYRHRQKIVWKNPKIDIEISLSWKTIDRTRRMWTRQWYLCLHVGWFRFRIKCQCRNCSRYFSKKFTIAPFASGFGLCSMVNDGAHSSRPITHLQTKIISRKIEDWTYILYGVE